MTPFPYQAKEARRAKQVRQHSRDVSAIRDKLRCVECGAHDHVGAVRWYPGVSRLLCETCGGYTEDTPTLEDMQPEWMDRAWCRGADVVGDVGHRTFSTTFVRKYCVRCPVWQECARFAWRTEGWSLYSHEPGTQKSHAGWAYWFVFGGLTPDERREADSEEQLVKMAAWRLSQVADEIAVKEDEARRERLARWIW